MPLPCPKSLLAVPALLLMAAFVLGPAFAAEPGSSPEASQATRPVSQATAPASQAAVPANGAAVPAGGGAVAAKPANDTAKPDPVKAKMAAKLERKLRTEYLKATAGIVGPTLKADSLLTLLEDTNLVLIDVRQPEEQAVSMIPHAITTADFAARFRKGIPKAKRLVVYCTIGYRSGKYAMTLAAQGIIAENLEGGLLAWSHAGGPLEVRNAAGLATPTRRVHIYSSGWNFLHPDYDPVW